jgi:DNA mismatch repair ATPase MutS
MYVKNWRSRKYRRELDELREALKSLRELRRGAYWVMAGNQGKIGGNPLDILADYLRMILHLDIFQFNRMLEKLRKKTGQVETMLAITGYLDMAISVGGFRKSLEGYCIPKLEEDTEKAFLHMKKGWHPLLSQPVKNSIRADRGILLTGSNASGKSTFLKMVAVNAVLAQTIHTCAAESYHAPIFQIFSSMALRDSMENGESYYIVEIRSLKRILDAAGERRTPVLCFVDEVLRGTNTVERIAAATQILIRLAESGTLGFAATHDIEMTELLKEYYDNYHFEEVIRDGDILFPYQLLPGKASTRNAIRLLQMMGYEEQIIKKASGQAENFLKTGKWINTPAAISEGTT